MVGNFFFSYLFWQNNTHKYSKTVMYLQSNLHNSPPNNIQSNLNFNL